jgi:DNA-binding transcriptional LysR family regulator
MNLQQLRYVKALVERGSFVAAASSCSVTQPTLSNGIAQLEAELGYRLFRRTTRSVRLTQYGEQLLPTVLQILSLFEKLRELSKIKLDKATTVFQVGVSPLAGIKRAGRILSQFRQSHPSVEIVFRESSLEDLCEQLDRGQIDIMIAQSPSDLMAVPDCISFPIEQDPLVFLPVLNHESKWNDVSSVSPSHIANEALVMVSHYYGLSRIISKLFTDSKLEFRRYPTEASNFEAVKEFAEAGIACGLLPKSKLGDYEGKAIPLVSHLTPLSIEYFVSGRPHSVSSELFPQLWDSLLKSKTVTKQAAFSWSSIESRPNP